VPRSSKHKGDSALQKLIHSELAKLIGKRTLPSASTQANLDELVRLRLSVPTLRKLFKEVLTPSTQWTLKEWSELFNSTLYFEVRSLCLYAFQYRSLSLKEISTVATWVHSIDCWEHSDDLAKILARAFEERPRALEQLYLEWNRSPNPWVRRQSLTGLIEYARLRKRVARPTFLLSQVEGLLDDPEYYVQKAVGWTLREIGQVYPKQTLKFLQIHLLKLDSRAFSAAMEKLPEDLRAEFRERRKLARQYDQLGRKNIFLALKKSIDR
jgi:3-methyladenine DNA glycosylase AlkD